MELLISFMRAGTCEVTGSVEGWMFSEQLSPLGPLEPSGEVKSSGLFIEACVCFAVEERTEE